MALPVAYAGVSWSAGGLSETVTTGGLAQPCCTGSWGWAALSGARLPVWQAEA